MLAQLKALLAQDRTSSDEEAITFLKFGLQSKPLALKSALSELSGGLRDGQAKQAKVETSFVDFLKPSNFLESYPQILIEITGAPC